MTNDRKKRAERAEQMRKERQKADKRQRNIISIAIVAIVVALVGVGGYAIKTTSDSNAKNTELVAPEGATDDYGIVYDAAAAGATPETDAEPVSVEVYEDFQCPVCQSFEQQVGPFLQQQVEAGEIELTYRPFSFLNDPPATPNRYSERATNVAICALDAGGVEDYKTVHDYLYANQPEEGTPGPENGELATAVEDLGITGLEPCIRTERFVPWVQAAYEAGQDEEVSGTPTVFVAGERLEDFSAQSIQAAVDAA